MMKSCIAGLAVLMALPVWAADAPKGLTPSQVEGLRAGRGMGMSLPAELNGQPGPLHVLELAQALNLDAAQREAMAALVDAMKAAAIPLGERVIEREAALDALFAQPSPDEPAIAQTVGQIGQLNADLRLVHLRTHLAAARLLTSEQIARYRQLRLYHHG